MQPMQYMGINFSVKCDPHTILQALKRNREKHAALVKEANEGYIALAKRELGQRLGALQEGKVVSLRFTLAKPKDYTPIYDTAIAMIESHQGQFIELSAEEYRHLIRDEWAWTEEWLNVNSSYSAGTRALMGDGED